MRYICEDIKVFNTKQEYLEHYIFKKKRIEEERAKKEQFETERKELLKEVKNLYEALEQKVREYEIKCGLDKKVYFAPFYEILSMLCR